MYIRKSVKCLLNKGRVCCTHFDIVVRKHSFLAVFEPFHPSVGHGFDVGDYVTFLQRQLVRLAGHIIELDHSLCAHTTNTHDRSFRQVRNVHNSRNWGGEEQRVSPNGQFKVSNPFRSIAHIIPPSISRLKRPTVFECRSTVAPLTHRTSSVVGEVFHLAADKRVQPAQRRRRPRHVMSVGSAANGVRPCERRAPSLRRPRRDHFIRATRRASSFHGRPGPFCRR